MVECYSTLRYGTAKNKEMQLIAEHSTTQPRKAKHSKEKHNTTQQSTTHHIKIKHKMQSNAMEVQ